MLTIQMMEWWYQSAEERMSAPTVYPPPPPPPPPKVKETLPSDFHVLICVPSFYEYNSRPVN